MVTQLVHECVMVELEDGMKVNEKKCGPQTSNKDTHLDKQTSVRRYEDDVTMNAGGRFGSGSYSGIWLLLYYCRIYLMKIVHCLDFKF